MQWRKQLFSDVWRALLFLFLLGELWLESLYYCIVLLSMFSYAFLFCGLITKIIYLICMLEPIKMP